MRQPIHTVYGGAHLFRKDVCAKLGAIAERSMKEYAPDAAALGRVTGMPEELAETVYSRVMEKLRREPVENFHIDFEDGFGVRADAEEDAAAVAAAGQVAEGIGGGDAAGVFGDSSEAFQCRVEGAGVADSADFSRGRWRAAGEFCGGVAEDYCGRTGKRFGGGFGGFSWRAGGVDGGDS